MSTEDWIANLLLVALVVRQIRGRSLTPFGLLWPVGLVGWFVVKYVRAVPSGAAPAVFVGAAVVLGTGLGVACAVLTRVTRNTDGRPWARASLAAAALWVLGTGSRLAFELYATHGGGASIERFSRRHGLHGISVWADALVLMALAEVLGRSVVLAVRAHRLPSDPSHATAARALTG